MNTLKKRIEPEEKNVTKLLHIHEGNIDGCNGYADVLAFVQVSTETNMAEKMKELKTNLTEIKKRCSEECLDTDDMVSIALKETFGEGNYWDAGASYVEF